MSEASLAVELLTEELPPKALNALGEAFSRSLENGLRALGFLADGAVVTAFATPRRLAACITHVRLEAADSEVVEKLMPRSVAEDKSGKPTLALEKRLAKIGRGHLLVDYPKAWDGPDHLYVASDGKSEYVWLRRLAKSPPLQRGLEDVLEEAIAALPIPKVMQYATPGAYYNSIAFVRPAHRLLALHGPNIVPVSALGLEAGRTTDGHRFMSRPGLEIATAAAYEETLQAEGKIIPGFAERRARIVADLEKAAAGAVVIKPDALLDEVTALVEWPAIYAGTFDASFLAVPQECLILTMQQNQKYFALADGDGRLRNRFLLVSNLATTEPASIIEGNERVLHARLADARFFYDQDRKQSLSARLPKLRSIVYHHQLGTLAERMDRVVYIAGEIGERLGCDRAWTERAARLAKADLVTDMVGEFPELQGLMGRYYAEHDGEPPAVAKAIEQHYWPRFAGDALPEDGVAQAVALADKLEVLTGMFGIGAHPTGDKDPFGLRRAAVGVLRILIEKQVPLTLPELVSLSFEAFDNVPALQDAQGDVLAFLYDRLRGYLRELGYSANQIAAVVDAAPPQVHLVPARLAAVQSFEAMPEAQTLAAANKRIVNILRKANADAGIEVDRARLADGAEHDLYLAFEKLGPLVNDHCAAGDYSGALRELATAKVAVDRFFDDCMVMADDPAIRANRLALLRRVAGTMNRVADISKLAV